MLLIVIEVQSVIVCGLFQPTGAAFGPTGPRLVCQWGSQVEGSGCPGLAQSPVVGPGVQAEDVAALLPGTSREAKQEMLSVVSTSFLSFVGWHFQSH